MKTMKKYIKMVVSSLLLAGVAFTSCTEDPNLWEQDSQYDRMFRPTDFTIKNITASTAEGSWKSVPGTQDYILEVCMDANFTVGMVDTFYIDGKTTSFIMKGLIGEIDYNVRLSSRSTDSQKAVSKCSTVTFKTKGSQIMLLVQDGDIADKSMVLRWDASGIVCDRIRVINQKTLSEKDIPITAAEFTAGIYTLENLEEGTPYMAELFVRTFKQGYRNFVTKSSIPPSDQTYIFNTEVDEFNQELFDKFQSGSVTLILPVESTITFTPPAGDLTKTSINIPADVKLSIVGNPEGKRSTLKVPTFNFLGGTTSLKIQNLNVTAAPENFYIINLSEAVTVDVIEIDDCYVYDFKNTPFRLQSSKAPVVNTLKIHNSIFNKANEGYDFIVTSSGGSSWKNIQISNSTFYNWGGARSFIAINAASPDMENITIKNCTFDNFLGSGKYFIDLSATKKAQTITIENSILGKTSNAASKGIRVAAGGAISIIETYATKDFVLGGNSISGLTLYEGTSSDLFQDPGNGIFRFKDDGFTGKKTSGDPRWFSE